VKKTDKRFFQNTPVSRMCTPFALGMGAWAGGEVEGKRQLICVERWCFFLLLLTIGVPGLLECTTFWQELDKDNPLKQIQKGLQRQTRLVGQANPRPSPLLFLKSL